MSWIEEKLKNANDSNVQVIKVKTGKEEEELKSEALTRGFKIEFFSQYPDFSYYKVSLNQ
jgi:hypothetical protein